MFKPKLTELEQLRRNAGWLQLLRLVRIMKKGHPTATL